MHARTVSRSPRRRPRKAGTEIPQIPREIPGSCPATPASLCRTVINWCSWRNGNVERDLPPGGCRDVPPGGGAPRRGEILYVRQLHLVGAVRNASGSLPTFHSSSGTSACRRYVRWRGDPCWESSGEAESPRRPHPGSDSACALQRVAPGLGFLAPCNLGWNPGEPGSAQYSSNLREAPLGRARRRLPVLGSAAPEAQTWPKPHCILV